MNLGIKNTISAGGIVRKLEGGKVFALLTKIVGKPDWLIPKGHVEAGETIEEAAWREVGEETGLKNIKISKKLGVKKRLSFRREEYKTIHYFLFDWSGGEELPKEIAAGADCLEPAWFPIDNLPKLFWPEQEELIRESLEAINEAAKK